MDGVTGPTLEWAGMPEIDQQDKFAYQRIVVHFKDKESVNKFSSLVGP